MTFELGIKSDPIEYRYSYEWLFRLMEQLGVRYVQMGSSVEMYHLPDRYFLRLRRQAEDHGLRIHSCFTAHRELGGLLSDDEDLRRVANDNYRRWMEIGTLVGAATVGSNPGGILRDEMDAKQAAEERYLEAMQELRAYAADAGLQALTLETMSAIAEPPTTKAEISRFMQRLNPPGETGAGDRVRTPVYICADMAHGYADASGQVVESNLALFEHAIPWMWEYHIKNTDAVYASTFGFGPGEIERGIVNLREVAELIRNNASRFPHDLVVGYLEHPGPKLGRDYSDGELESLLRSSIEAIQRDFLPALEPSEMRI